MREPGDTRDAAYDVAALYVETNGVYFGLPGVDPWDEQRDARLYAGPHPVVAHPPCARWSSLVIVLPADVLVPVTVTFRPLATVGKR